MEIINIRNAPKGFKKIDGIHLDRYVYIGRPGYFGNPIKISNKYGNFKCSECGEYHFDGGSTLKCYKLYLIKRMKSDLKFRNAILNLKDKILVCFCKPKPCHGDVIISILNKIERLKINNLK